MSLVLLAVMVSLSLAASSMSALVTSVRSMEYLTSALARPLTVTTTKSSAAGFTAAVAVPAVPFTVVALPLASTMLDTTTPVLEA